LQERLDIDYDIARALIDEVLPYSLEYYLEIKHIDEDLAEDEVDSDDEKDKKVILIYLISG
jgi:nucleosome assembly protein 1-like 1